MEKATKWSGVYRGVNFEIVRHVVNPEYRPQGIWNYYITLHKDRFVNQTDTKRFFLKIKKTPNVIIKKHDYYYSYNNSEVPLEMHGGITYYAYTPINHRNTGWIKNIVKIGCDYSHYWDEGNHQDEKRLEYDVKKCIDKFHASFKYLIWCNTDGELREEKEIEYKSNKAWAGVNP